MLREPNSQTARGLQLVASGFFCASRSLRLAGPTLLDAGRF
jgi:hypothetical protein